jgi:hypothetical protein
MNIDGLNQIIAYDLAELKSDINFAIFRHAASRASNDTARINEDAINEWHERVRCDHPAIPGERSGRWRLSTAGIISFDEALKGRAQPQADILGQRDSCLRLALELVEEAPVAVPGDDLIGSRLKFSKVVQPEQKGVAEAEAPG